MLQQITIPKPPEDIAASLAKLDRENRRYVEGVIVTLAATAPQRMTTDTGPGQART